MTFFPSFFVFPAFISFKYILIVMIDLLSFRYSAFLSISIDNFKLFETNSCPFIIYVIWYRSNFIFVLLIYRIDQRESFNHLINKFSFKGMFISNQIISSLYQFYKIAWHYHNEIKRNSSSNSVKTKLYKDPMK